MVGIRGRVLMSYADSVGCVQTDRSDYMTIEFSGQKTYFQEFIHMVIYKARDHVP